MTMCALSSNITLSYPPVNQQPEVGLCALRSIGARRDRQSVELLHKGEKISHTPVVGDLSLPDAHHINTLEMNLAVSWSDAEKRSLVRAVVRLVCRHPVAIGE